LPEVAGLAGTTNADGRAEEGRPHSGGGLDREVGISSSSRWRSTPGMSKRRASLAEFSSAFGSAVASDEVGFSVALFDFDFMVYF